MKNEKVGLREQLLEKWHKIVAEHKWKGYMQNEFEAFELGYNLCNKEFLDASPQTREIQKLLEDRPKMKISCEGHGVPIFYIKGKVVADRDIEEWFDEVIPKLEAFCADHVSREKLGKLIEDFPTLDLEKPTNTADFIEFVIRTREYRKRLEKLLTKKGGE